jgi:hypothetical protein
MHVCVVFYFRLLSLCVPTFPAFKRVFLSAFVRLLIHLLRIDVPSSHRLSFVHLCACHLHVDFHLFVILGTVHMWAGVFAY